MKGTEQLKAKVMEAGDKKRRAEVEMREQGGMEVDAHDK